MSEPGQRIGAVLCANDDEVELIGFGTYEGDHVPGDDAVGVMAKALKNMQVKNPKLVMDDGTIVWGCECWWGDENAVNEQIGNRKVVYVNMDKVRESYV